MRILIDLTSLNDNFSGIERYALNIAKNMILQDRENYYILIFKNEIHKEFLEYKDMENISIRVFNGNNKLVFNQLILPLKLYKNKADLYLFFAFPSPILFRNKNCISTVHDLTAWLYPETMNFKSKLFFKAAIKNAIRSNRCILTVSESSKNDIISKFNINKIEVIGNVVSQVFENFKYNESNNIIF